MGGLARPALAVALLLALVSTATSQSCEAVTAEFALTGLRNADGHIRNHELGICLPHFRLQLFTNCTLRITPMYSQGATVSLFTVGSAGGKPSIPRATDAPAAVSTAVESSMGYYYLRPIACPSSYTTKVLGARLLASDVGDAIRRTLSVPSSVLSSSSFTSNGMTISWLMDGSTANQLTYTAISKSGATNPDFNPFQGSTNSACSLLDINPANNPATAVLVGRVPRAIPKRSGFFICAIAPAGGSVKVSPRSSGGLQYAYSADNPTQYGSCPAGSYLYKLGAITSPGDANTDSCSQCPRGSFAVQGTTLCSPCPTGQYNPTVGQRACKPCLYGYAAQPGAIRCMNCYYGRAYCSEGWSNNEKQYTCNSKRLPSGYTPDAGYSIVRPLTDPTSATAAASYSNMFASCTVDSQNSVMAMNVSAECRVQLYVLGDLGQTQAGCSQNADANSITAYYTAPNTLAGLYSQGINKVVVGIQATLASTGFLTQVFAAGFGNRVPAAAQTPTVFTIGLTPTGYSYLGGGDDGQGRNALVRGVRQAPCPPGTTLQLLNADGVDNPGEDPRQLLNNYCVPCGVGTYCDTLSSTQSTMCPAGTYGPTIGARTVDGCVNCPVGTYQDMDGAFECRVCDPNTFASSPGAVQCSPCGDGYQVTGDGANFCNACPSGTYRLAAESDTCQPCQAGTYSGQAAAQCTICKPGSYSAKARAGYCNACPRGSFQSRYGATKCDVCPKGSYQDARSQPRCKVCPVGTFNNLTGSSEPGACMTCPAGTAAPVPGSGSCSKCGAGYYSARPGSSSCLSCKPGTFSAADGSTTCTPCPRGQFSNNPASQQCKPCAIGFFSSTPGASKCQSCPAGAFTNGTGSVLCRQCPAGTYSTRTGANNVVTCAACPAGTFSYMSGSTRCTQCPAGQYAPQQGSTNCQDCPLGTYSNSAGSMRCLPCRAGFTTASTGSSAVGDCNVQTVLNNINARKS